MRLLKVSHDIFINFFITDFFCFSSSQYAVRSGIEKSRYYRKRRVDGWTRWQFCIIVLKLLLWFSFSDERVITCFKNLMASHSSISDQPLIVIGTTLQSDKLGAGLSSTFLYRFSIDVSQIFKTMIIFLKIYFLATRRKWTPGIDQSLVCPTCIDSGVREKRKCLSNCSTDCGNAFFWNFYWHNFYLYFSGFCDRRYWTNRGDCSIFGFWTHQKYVSSFLI